ncbi:MAG: hypothetical protein V1722_03680 [Candidatus Micrarchaeota archaeon]
MSKSTTQERNVIEITRNTTHARLETPMIVRRTSTGRTDFVYHEAQYVIESGALTTRGRVAAVKRIAMVLDHLNHEKLATGRVPNVHHSVEITSNYHLQDTRGEPKSGFISIAVRAGGHVKKTKIRPNAPQLAEVEHTFRRLDEQARKAIVNAIKAFRLKAKVYTNRKILYDDSATGLSDFDRTFRRGEEKPEA